MHESFYYGLFSEGLPFPTLLTYFHVRIPFVNRIDPDQMTAALLHIKIRILNPRLLFTFWLKNDQQGKLKSHLKKLC